MSGYYPMELLRVIDLFASDITNTSRCIKVAIVTCFSCACVDVVRPEEPVGGMLGIEYVSGEEDRVRIPK